MTKIFSRCHGFQWVRRRRLVDDDDNNADLIPGSSSRLSSWNMTWGSRLNVSFLNFWFRLTIFDIFKFLLILVPHSQQSCSHFIIFPWVIPECNRSNLIYAQPALLRIEKKTFSGKCDKAVCKFPKRHRTYKNLDSICLITPGMSRKCTEKKLN